jgi:biotin operon repressor
MSEDKKNRPTDTVVKVGRQGTLYQQKSTDSHRTSGYTEDSQEEEYEVVIDKTAAEILDQINQRVKSPYYSVFIGIPTGICFFLGLGLPIPFFILFIAGSIATYKLYQKDIIRKTTPLIYEFEDDFSKQKYDEFNAALQNLSSTKSLWRLKSQIAIEDWKRNAGSNSLIVRQRSKIGQITPSLIKTNINAWGIDSGSIKLYLLPDLIFVFQNGVYGTITFEDLRVDFENLEYSEHETVPQDTTIIGKTWKFVRRDGAADRRFKNNRQIPIVNYGLVHFVTQYFVLYLIVSNSKLALGFTNSFSKLLGFSNPDDLQIKTPLHQPNNTLQIAKDITENFEILNNAFFQKQQLSTSQLANTLGISKSSITKNQDSFEYEGYCFKRAGRVGREIAWQVIKIKK